MYKKMVNNLNTFYNQITLLRLSLIHICVCSCFDLIWNHAVKRTKIFSDSNKNIRPISRSQQNNQKFRQTLLSKSHVIQQFSQLCRPTRLCGRGGRRRVFFFSVVDLPNVTAFFPSISFSTFRHSFQYLSQVYVFVSPMRKTSELIPRSLERKN